MKIFNTESQNMTNINRDTTNQNNELFNNQNESEWIGNRQMNNANEESKHLLDSQNVLNNYESQLDSSSSQGNI